MFSTGRGRTLAPELPASPKQKNSPGIFLPPCQRLPSSAAAAAQPVGHKARAGPCTPSMSRAVPALAPPVQPPSRTNPPGSRAQGETPGLSSKLGASCRETLVPCTPGHSCLCGHHPGEHLHLGIQHSPAGLWEQPQIPGFREGTTGMVCRARAAGFPVAQRIFPMAHSHSVTPE